MPETLELLESVGEWDEWKSICLKSGSLWGYRADSNDAFTSHVNTFSIKTHRSSSAPTPERHKLAENVTYLYPVQRFGNSGWFVEFQVSRIRVSAPHVARVALQVPVGLLMTSCFRHFRGEGLPFAPDDRHNATS